MPSRTAVDMVACTRGNRRDVHADRLEQITPALRTIRRLGEVSVEHIPSSVEPVQVENEPSTLSSLILVGKFDPPRTFLLFMDLSFCAGRSLHSEARP
jgi:hypothetical protein